ncbi:hypothetical protein MXL46_09350 [Heyndrickxia sporothermodurans]|uniref:hypothetical protein n=1 Tax=Heyndrickxia sporothermodurans TaxID=46224 RepID=UPI002DB67BB8|nr:hypothetical protein [Heyndrickxia sporothermodurans]MEB6549299.1 hypothetical protein [Heyndrickxia sporothermodurans]
MHSFIENIYSDINIHRWEQFKDVSVENVINEVSERLGIQTLFYDYPTELNNLGGEWRIFLNRKQSKNDMWQDFGKSMAVYTNYQYFLEGKATSELINFPFYFCVPKFLMNQLAKSAQHMTREQIIHEISQVFHVKYEFAEMRLKLHCAC